MRIVTILSNNELRAALMSSAAAIDCSCNVHRYLGWESVSDSEWPRAQLTRIASLRDETVGEPGFDEFHPDGTRYDSALAPISIGYFPYNRSDLWRCNRCQRYALRYTEFGGYYVDHRARWVRAELIAP